jgi:hypothetical protein
MGFLSNTGSLFCDLFGGSVSPVMADKFPTAKDAKPKGNHVDVASILSALQGLGGASPPPVPPPPEWMPMPPPSPMMADLRNAPRLAQRPLMPAPDWMQPYLWGVR